MSRQLTPKEARFVDEYLVDLNATQAAERAGYSKRTAGRQGHLVMHREPVARAIAARMKRRAERVEIDQDWVLRKWIAIVEADESELVQYLRDPCPDCWGDEHADEIDPNCHACHGRGRGRVIVTDTREMSEGAKALYAGVQVGKEGIRVSMHSKETALTNIARHLGMFPSKVELTGKDDGPVRVVIAGDDTRL